MFRLGMTLAAAGLVGLAYLFGAYSYSHSIAPLPQILKLIEPDINNESLIAFDDYRRLVKYPGKEEIPCPPQTSDTLVLLTIGQSNAANVAGQRYKSEHGPRVVNYFAGKCFVASSPLIGANNSAGESWTLLGNKLISAGLAKTVILIPSAIGRSTVARWAHGDLRVMLDEVLERLGYRVSYVLWHQGEEDFVRHTSAEDYAEAFHSLAARFDVPVFVSVATRCGLNAEWTLQNPIADAQRALPDGARIFAGVDTDSLLEPEDRYEDCHFSGSGQEKFATAWTEILRSATTRALESSTVGTSRN
jgi:carbohydrate esterase-like sialic acid-specific acetylesterase